MGHGDEIGIGDGNFPAASMAARLVRLDGHSVPEVLEAAAKLFPLDTYSDPNTFVMEVASGDTNVKGEPPVWAEYKKILTAAEGSAAKFGAIERFAFYERAKKAYAIVATGESALYANIILKKINSYQPNCLQQKSN